LALQLAFALGVIGCGTIEDQEAIVDNRKVIVLILVVDLVLLRCGRIA
jgi:hypothetical protein